MPTVTRLAEYPRRPGRYRLELDGELAGLVGVGEVARFGLRIGSEVSDDVLGALQEAIADLAAFDRAAASLARRARSARGLERYLTTKGEPASRARRAVERLAALGVLDDTAFAEGFARTRAAARIGRHRVARELAAKGVAREVIDAALAHAYGDAGPDQVATARAVAERRARTLRHADPRTRRAKLYAFLLRRGFSGEEARAAVRAVLAGG